MSISRGTERYRKCIEYLEAKYDPNVSEETYKTKLSEYMAFDQASRQLSDYYASALKEDHEKVEDAEDLENGDEEEESDDDYEVDGEFVVDDEEGEDDEEDEEDDDDTTDT